MSQSALLKKTAASLDHLGEPYMFTGSFVSSLQGEPRSTHDIDLVFVLSADKIDALLAEFPAPEYYANRATIEQAIARRDVFNIVAVNEGDKVDFWLLKDDAFDQSRFARRKLVNYDGMEVFVSAAEDTILMKLKWDHDSGGGTRQFYDALRVYELQHAILDHEYLQHWIHELQLGESWQEILARAKPVR